MTPRARPLSENGKVLAMCILFPVFWPFIPVLLICFAGEAIRNAYWDWRYRKARSAAAQDGRETPD